MTLQLDPAEFDALVTAVAARIGGAFPEGGQGFSEGVVIADIIETAETPPRIVIDGSTSRDCIIFQSGHVTEVNPGDICVDSNPASFAVTDLIIKASDNGVTQPGQIILGGSNTVGQAFIEADGVSVIPQQGAIELRTLNGFVPGGTLSVLDLNANLARIGTAAVEAGARKSIARIMGASAASFVGAAVDPKVTQIQVQAGTAAVLTNAFGLAVVAYPVAFPTGVLAVVLTRVIAAGDTNVLELLNAGNTAAQFQVAYTNKAGGGAGVAANIVFNWLAIGW